MSSNFHFDVSAESHEHFQMMMQIAFQRWGKDSKTTATNWEIDPEKGMILYTREEEDTEKLPYPMGRGSATQFAWNWLQENAAYPREPDHDGDNKKGWRVYNDRWARVGKGYSGFVAIQPVWMMYGK